MVVLPVLVLIPLMLIILALSGGINSRRRNIATTMERESRYIERYLNEAFGRISALAPQFSRTLSQGLEDRIRKLRGGPAPLGALNGSPAELEKLLDGQIESLLSALGLSGASGVFMILDATANPGGAEYSRPGLYLKNAGPALPSPSAFLLRGFDSLAAAHGLQLRPNWEPEFDVRNMDYYRRPREWYRTWSGPDWSIAEEPGGGTAVFCTVPLIDSDGRFMGIGGFEFGGQQFGSGINPAAGEYPNLFAALADFSARDRIDPGRALFAGKSSVYREPQREGFTVRPGPASAAFEVFAVPGGGEYIGRKEVLAMNRESALPFDGNFAVIVAMPRAEFDRLVLFDGLRLALILAAFLAAGAVFSVALVRRYFAGFPAEQDREPATDFERLGLTSRERQICDLLLHGLTIRQISLELNIAFDTANSHYRKIYRKLGVSSKSELFLKFGGIQAR